MSKRKPIYVLRMSANGIELTGRVTIAVNPFVQGKTAQRKVMAAFLKQLRAVGIEASPKQPEAHRSSTSEEAP